jgi:hypothetical protein
MALLRTADRIREAEADRRARASRRSRLADERGVRFRVERAATAAVPWPAGR